MTLIAPFLALALAGASTPAPQPSSLRATLDRVAATVNGDVITLRELERNAGSALVEASALAPGPERDHARALALRSSFDTLVAERLFRQQVKKLDLEVSEGQIDAQIEAIKAQNHFDEPTFDRALVAQGLTRASFRERIRNQLQDFAVLQYKVGGKVKVSDQELENYYRSHPQEFNGEDEVHVRHVFLPLAESAPASEVRQVQEDGERILQRLRAGEDFAEVARLASRGPSADSGGESGLASPWHGAEGPGGHRLWPSRWPVLGPRPRFHRLPRPEGRGAPQGGRALLRRRQGDHSRSPGERAGRELSRPVRRRAPPRGVHRDPASGPALALPALPRIAVSVGDPSGIGPEVTGGALLALRRELSPLVFGDARHLTRELSGLGLPLVGPEAIPPRGGALVAVTHLPVRDLKPGRPTARGGDAQLAYLTSAFEAVRRGEASALCTAPVSKAQVSRSLPGFVGHTEWLEARCGIRRSVMMLAGSRLRIALVTNHLAFARIRRAITLDRIVETISITHRALSSDLGIHRPRLALAALNPHAGEQGAFGQEERTLLSPALARASALGFPAAGPFPADSVFFRAALGEFDAVVALYHDQGLIPVKLLDAVAADPAVNVTLGLPIVRTSPDHGVAYDLAGSGRANPASMVAALRLAARMVGARASIHRPAVRARRAR